MSGSCCLLIPLRLAVFVSGLIQTMGAGLRILYIHKIDDSDYNLLPKIFLILLDELGLAAALLLLLGLSRSRHELFLPSLLLTPISIIFFLLTTIHSLATNHHDTNVLIIKIFLLKLYVIIYLCSVYTTFIFYKHISRINSSSTMGRGSQGPQRHAWSACILPSPIIFINRRRRGAVGEAWQAAEEEDTSMVEAVTEFTADAHENIEEVWKQFGEVAKDETIEDIIFDEGGKDEIVFNVTPMTTVKLSSSYSSQI